MYRLPQTGSRYPTRQVLHIYCIPSLLQLLHPHPHSLQPHARQSIQAFDPSLLGISLTRRTSRLVRYNAPTSTTAAQGEACNDCDRGRYKGDHSALGCVRIWCAVLAGVRL